MPGLFSTLNLAARSLQTQQVGVEVAGQNLANVNNAAYSRQRVTIQSSITVPTAIGPQGTGADVVAITQIRSALVDAQMQSELSVGGYWSAQQSALQYAQANLGEYIDRQAQSVDGSSGASSATAIGGLAKELSSLFNAFQSVATSPATITERQLLLNQAQTLASSFNAVAGRFDDLKNTLNTSLNDDIASANKLLTAIADLNAQIADAEFAQGGVANDLRDLRQQKLEQLSALVNVETGADAAGNLTVSVSGVRLVSGRNVLDTLETYDAGGGQMLIRSSSAAVPLALTGGSIQGTIDARDGSLATLRSGFDTLAAQLIAEVNAVHATGFSLTGSTGANFFNGTDAASISVNPALTADPGLVQAAGVAGASRNNAVALTLAQLADKPIAALGNSTFAGAYGQIVTSLGKGLSDANDQIADHDVMKSMLARQRDSISGVSVDEEMTDLMRFQRAYQASARLVTTVDEMLDTVLNLKR